MTANPNRQPRGIPAGGQYAPSPHGRPSFELDAPDVPDDETIEAVVYAALNYHAALRVAECAGKDLDDDCQRLGWHTPLEFAFPELPADEERAADWELRDLEACAARAGDRAVRADNPCLPPMERIRVWEDAFEASAERALRRRPERYRALISTLGQAVARREEQSAIIDREIAAEKAEHDAYYPY